MSKDGGDDGYEVSAPPSVKWPTAAPRLHSTRTRCNSEVSLSAPLAQIGRLWACQDWRLSFSSHHEERLQVVWRMNPFRQLPSPWRCRGAL